MFKGIGRFLAKRIWLLVLIAAVTGGYFLSSYLFSVREREFELPLQAQEPPERFGEGALLVTRELFDQCGHEQVQVRALPPELVGSTVDEAAGVFRDWVVLSASSSELEVFKMRPGLCEEDQLFRHLAIRDDRVAVMYGKPRPGAPLKELTDIRADSLLKEDIERLREGIILRGDLEVKQFLDGLSD